MSLYRGLGATSYVSQVQFLAPSYGIPPSLAVALMNRESSGNPAAVSSAGAIGLFQLMPATAASLGVNPNDPTQNIKGGLSYLQSLYNQYGNWNDALVAYNEGPGAFAAHGAYASSQDYASSILSAAGDLGDGADSSAFTSANDLSTVLGLPALVDLAATTGLSWEALTLAGLGVFGVIWAAVRR